MMADEMRDTSYESREASGFDLDVWGGEDTTPVLIPRPEDRTCVEQMDGKCPAGCDDCRRFAEDWGQPQRTQGDADCR